MGGGVVIGRGGTTMGRLSSAARKSYVAALVGCGEAKGKVILSNAT